MFGPLRPACLTQPLVSAVLVEPGGDPYLDFNQAEISMSTWSTPYIRRLSIGLVIVLLTALIGGGYAFLTDSPPDGLTDGPPSASVSPSEPSTPAAARGGAEHALQSQKAPDFSLKQMNGETFRLSDHRGEVVVVNFWATWCPPCRMEIPGFIKLQKELRDRGLTFVGISLDEGGFDTVRPYAQEMKINYPLVLGRASVVQKYGGVRGLPTTFVVDPEGRIAFARSGFLSEKQLRETLEPLLKQADRTGT